MGVADPHTTGLVLHTTVFAGPRLPRSNLQLADALAHEGWRKGSQVPRAGDSAFGCCGSTLEAGVLVPPCMERGMHGACKSPLLRQLSCGRRLKPRQQGNCLREHSRQPSEREEGGPGQHPFLDTSDVHVKVVVSSAAHIEVLQPRLSRT
jgi:hypothetical protein